MKHIALIAATGAGKGEFVEYVSGKYGYGHLLMSDFIERTAKKYNLIGSSERLSDRAQKSKISNMLVEKLGSNYLAKMVVDEIEENPQRTYIIDGVRRIGELKEIKGRLGWGVVSIGISIDDSVRFVRLRKRDSASEEYINGLEEAARKYDIAQMIKDADYRVDNNGTLEEFQRSIVKVMADVL